MANPLTVGTTAIVAIPSTPNRASVRFQNVGTTILYFYRAPQVPSATHYEFVLTAPAGAETNEAFIITNSSSQFNVVSSADGGSVAIFETVKV